MLPQKSRWPKPSAGVLHGREGAVRSRAPDPCCLSPREVYGCKITQNDAAGKIFYSENQHFNIIHAFCKPGLTHHFRPGWCTARSTRSTINTKDLAHSASPLTPHLSPRQPLTGTKELDSDLTFIQRLLFLPKVTEMPTLDSILFEKQENRGFCLTLLSEMKGFRIILKPQTVFFT